ncbi:MAG: NUDIX hydrolase, partial [Desulfobulbales bacterium]
NRVWGRVYSCVYDGEVTLQAEEVESVFFAAPEAILDLCRKGPFTPDGIYVLQKFLQEKD